jgi:hypothetical protein
MVTKQKYRFHGFKKFAEARFVLQNLRMTIGANLTRRLSKSKMSVFFGPNW